MTYRPTGLRRVAAKSAASLYMHTHRQERATSAALAAVKEVCTIRGLVGSGPDSVWVVVPRPECAGLGWNQFDSILLIAAKLPRFLRPRTSGGVVTGWVLVERVNGEVRRTPHE